MGDEDSVRGRHQKGGRVVQEAWSSEDIHPSELQDLIREAVHRAIVPGEKTGILLSGGLDSSTVAILARERGEYPTFTGYYRGERYDERKYAHLVKSKDHHDILIIPQDFIECFDDLLEAVDPPYAGPGMLGQWVVAKYAREQGINSLLSGEGGDELFGGYARIIIVAGLPAPKGYENYRLPDNYPRELEAALKLEYEHLKKLLRIDDSICWAHRIFVAAPIAEDPLLQQVILSLPPELRVGKMLLKAAMRGVVPEPILRRKDKMGFPVPFVEWAQEEPLRSFLLERIGYLPDPSKPWDRSWWNHLIEVSTQR